jgi:hypothetical protein
LGELGRRGLDFANNVEEGPQLFQMLLQVLGSDDTEEEIKTASAFAIGNISVN